MATSLIAKRATTSIGRASDLFRTSFAFLRGLSTTTSPAADVASVDGAKKPKRKKKKNLFEVAQFLPNWGLGYHMAKTHWAEVSYEITKINLYKDGRHGKAWGIAHKNACILNSQSRPWRNLVPEGVCKFLSDTGLEALTFQVWLGQLSQLAIDWLKFASCRCPEENQRCPQALLEIHPHDKTNRTKCAKTGSKHPKTRSGNCVIIFKLSVRPSLH
ncbi:hypothetical protein SASPL_125173 [Salvia splendens]|uniref:Uncharacterized protein n=1 Tax=Salvia splendens TaxID=180675 RepID=A0A8X8XH64_SALSN|nr:hypothetical protein SASPL_125173 [Salvia splendens]